MDGVADTAGFIVAYPDGIGMAWDTIFINSPVDDIGFLSALLDTLLARYNIDTTRIYATGMSMGGFMTYRLACEAGGRLAAIASVAGPTVDSILSLCNSTLPIPVMHIHGTADSTVPYSGTELFNHVDSTIQYFINKNGCSSSPVIYDFPDIISGDGCTVTSYTYSCINFAEVLFYKVIDGGHTWPGGIPFATLGNTNGDINASVEIWKFFRRHQLQKTMTDIANPDLSHSLYVFPNPANEKFQIVLPENQKGLIQIQLYDMTGKLLKFFRLSDLQNMKMDLLDCNEGIYLIRVVTAKNNYQSLIVISR